MGFQSIYLGNHHQFRFYFSLALTSISDPVECHPVSICLIEDIDANFEGVFNLFSGFSILEAIFKLSYVNFNFLRVNNPRWLLFACSFISRTPENRLAQPRACQAAPLLHWTFRFDRCKSLTGIGLVSRPSSHRRPPSSFALAWACQL